MEGNLSPPSQVLMRLISHVHNKLVIQSLRVEVLEEMK